jgi:hypothetical protein
VFWAGSWCWAQNHQVACLVGCGANRRMHLQQCSCHPRSLPRSLLQSVDSCSVRVGVRAEAVSTECVVAPRLIRQHMGGGLGAKLQG